MRPPIYKFCFSFLTLLIGASPLSANARPNCLRLVIDHEGGRRAEREFWNGEGRVTVLTPQGRQPFAFGFDAELWHLSDVLALINSDPKARKKLAELLQKNAELHMTCGAMKKILGCESEAELVESLYAKNRKAKVLTFSDVKPEFLKVLFHSEEEKTLYARPLFPLVAMALKNRGIPVDAKHEISSGAVTQGHLGAGEAVELIQKGFSTNPREFRDLIKGFLHTETDYPETHFHVSIPVGALNWQQLLLAARALETKIVLEELVEELEYDGSLAPHDHSALAVPITSEPYDGKELWTSVDRGVVRVEMNRWKIPVRAHDVEIRMWLDADHGLSNMLFLMKLVQNANKLRDTSSFTGKEVPNIVPANLNASLRYAAFVLADRLPEKKAPIIEKLNAFADEIETAEGLSNRLRRKISKYVKKENVLKYLSLDTFLAQ